MERVANFAKKIDEKAHGHKENFAVSDLIAALDEAPLAHIRNLAENLEATNYPHGTKELAIVIAKVLRAVHRRRNGK